MPLAIFARPTETFPEFGKLEFTTHWRGHIALAFDERPFEVLVRAKRGGPSANQIAAMKVLTTNALQIRAQATPYMATLHRSAWFFPTQTLASDDQIWDHLIPNQIEVSDESYYGDGRIASLIIFGLKSHQDYGPAIETADGSFVQVLSGT